MPVVVVAAPVLPADRLQEALVSVAGTVAGALGLAPDDVVVSFAPLDAAVVGARPMPAWPVVTMHGNRRDPAAKRAAADDVSRVVAAAWSTTADQTWVHWLIRDEPS